MNQYINVDKRYRTTSIRLKFPEHSWNPGRLAFFFFSVGLGVSIMEERVGKRRRCEGGKRERVGVWYFG